MPLVIGYFGCIHKKHQALLTKYKKFNILTFNEIPRKSIDSLYGFEQRIENLVKYKPKKVYVYDLNVNMTSSEFINSVLLKLAPSIIIVGSDFKFGSDFSNIEQLKKYFKVNIEPYDEKYSTNQIKQLIKQGLINQVNELLDSNFYIESKWVSGMQLGRKIGFPTINTLYPNTIVRIKDGSYQTKIIIGKRTYDSITFVGSKKSVGENNQFILETYVINKTLKERIDYSISIQDHIKVIFYKYIRPNTKFDSLEQLKKAILNDVESIK